MRKYFKYIILIIGLIILCVSIFLVGFYCGIKMHPPAYLSSIGEKLYVLRNIRDQKYHYAIQQLEVSLLGDIMLLKTLKTEEQYTDGERKLVNAFKEYAEKYMDNLTIQGEKKGTF